MQKKTLFQKKNPALFDNNTILPNMFQFFFASYLPTYIDSRRIPSLHPLPTMYKMNSYGFRKVFFPNGRTYKVLVLFPTDFFH